MDIDLDFDDHPTAAASTSSGANKIPLEKAIEMSLGNIIFEPRDQFQLNNNHA